MEKLLFENKETFSEKLNSNNKEQITLSFSLKNCQKDIYYKISIINNDNLFENFYLFETEEIECKEDNSEISFSKKLNCNYYFNKRQILIINIIKSISFSSPLLSKKYERITVFSSLVGSPNSIYERTIRKNAPDSERLIIKLDKYINNNLNNQYYIFDFFKNGLKISNFISFDFSNGNNKQPISKTNNIIFYILKNISNLISNYTSNHLFYSYGFGGKIKKEDNFKNIFNINENSSPIKNYDEVMVSYNNIINKIIQDNQIYFSFLIRKVSQEIYKIYEIKFYNILFILTREIIDKSDIKDTVDAIIESSYLPLSIIIIGIGENNFNKMNKLFNDIPNNSSIGMKKMRDNVLFKSLNNDFDNDVEKMIEFILNDVKKQILYFYELIKFTPELLLQNNLINIKNSFSIYNLSVCINDNEEIFKNQNKEIIISKNFYDSVIPNKDEINKEKKENEKSIINFGREWDKEMFIESLNINQFQFNNKNAYSNELNKNNIFNLDNQKINDKSNECNKNIENIDNNHHDFKKINNNFKITSLKSIYEEKEIINPYNPYSLEKRNELNNFYESNNNNNNILYEENIKYNKE